MWHFLNAFKEVFWPKKDWISCWGLKVSFWQFFSFAKMALLNPCIKFKLFWPKNFFWSITTVSLTSTLPLRQLDWTRSYQNASYHCAERSAHLHKCTVQWLFTRGDGFTVNLVRTNAASRKLSAPDWATSLNFSFFVNWSIKTGTFQNFHREFLAL